jgi:hypothetical protein
MFVNWLVAYSGGQWKSVTLRTQQKIKASSYSEKHGQAMAHDNVAVWGDIHGAAVKRGDHLVGTARDRNEFELDAFAREEALLLGDEQIERRYAPYGRRDLSVTKGDGISCGVLDSDAQPRRNAKVAHDVACRGAHDLSQSPAIPN